MTTHEACDPVTGDPVITVPEPVANPLDIPGEWMVIAVSILALAWAIWVVTR